ncbi:MAG: pyridoxamine 5'-phosphate oxidase family protein [Epsilonproteobacteria bacterium]|nr:pyridoxamine 5'-phosphate oxidase family protein [Campylobacterota bacterium]
MSPEKTWEFIEQFDSMMISSITEEGLSHSSYAPFIKYEKCFYICTSGMAHHTKNLLSQAKASVMIIEDESECQNSFARKRVTFEMDVTHIKRESDLFSDMMSIFYEKFGEKASIYEQLTDFQLFALVPVGGRAVFGFGEAYDYKDGVFSAVGRGGHQTK